MAALRWGVLSAGSISHDFVVGLKSLPESEHKVVAVAARSLESAQKFAAKHSIPRAYGNYEDLTKDEEIDVVYVGTVAATHLAVALKMMDGGKPVLCEKPLTISVVETKAMIDKAKEKDTFLMEAVWTRFFPAVCELRSMIASGAIGEVKFVRANFSFRLPPERRGGRMTDPARGGGAILDLGVYPINFATMIFNERPIKIYAQGSLLPTGVDNLAAVTLTYSGGRIAQLTCSMSYEIMCDAVVCGTEGDLRLPPPFWCPTKLECPTETVGSEPITKDFPLPDPYMPTNFVNSCGLRYEAQEVKKCIDGGQKESAIMPLEHTLIVSEILEEAMRQLGVIYFK